MTIDFTERYRVKSWNLAVAVRPIEYKQELHEDWTFLGGDPDDENNYYNDVWWSEEKDWIYVVMVGDDAKHLVETDDLELISEDDYCGSCGQIGCGWC